MYNLYLKYMNNIKITLTKNNNLMYFNNGKRISKDNFDKLLEGGGIIITIF